ncbi:MAG: hypothetical protein Greene041662_346 [Candidatus Peregrinibacteria bacterium Greene0416_62]|nr:MAG: hypothetical protein Greene041662_346 [Candidatus Peregrinibacteria bacterium Greene0416_62]TSD00289.1 MAG: hypothetical protein Greene101449_223 [Candidatus Peregrinibacteria bacterium Greene1014_49]
MTNKLHFTELNLIVESRLCHFNGQPEQVQQTENADAPQKKEAKQSPEVRAESLHADVQKNTGEEVSKTTNGVQSLHEVMSQTDKRFAALKNDIAGSENAQALSPEQRANIEKITNSLAPEQQQVIRETIGQLDPSHQEALVTFVQKLTPDMCKRLQQNAPLSPDDVRLLGKILPTLNQQEMDLFMAMPIFDASGTMTDEDRRIFEAFPTMSKEDQLKVIMAMPIRVEQEQKQQSERRESMETSHQSVGFITDAAMNLLERAGYISPGQGTDKLENKLNISGKPEKTNYTAIGSTLYVETIDADGTAQKFAVPMTGMSFVERVKAMLNGEQNKQEQPHAQQKISEKINAIATYKTAKIGTIYKKSPEYLGIADDSIKTGGKLPELLKEADKSNIIIQLADNNVEANIIAKKDGKILSKSTESINDRDQWENGIAKMLDEALEKTKAEKKQS